MSKPRRPTLRERLRHADPAIRAEARRRLRATFEQLDGDVAKTARRLGLTTATVRRWVLSAAQVQRGVAEPTAAPPKPAGGPSATAQRPARKARRSAGRRGATAASAPPAPRARSRASAPDPPAAPATARAASENHHRAALEAGRQAGPVAVTMVPAATAPPAAEPAEGFGVRFHPRPHLEPPVFVRAGADSTEERPQAARRLAFVLHAHLPWVLGHGTWPHGEDWLAEAVTHCYLPLLDTFDRLAAKGRRHLLTFSVTPILAAQLADPRTRTLVDGYLAQRAQSAREAKRRHPLSHFWIEEYARLEAIWQRFDRDLIGVLRRLAAEEAIEVATSAATHPYLPLTQTRELIRLALATGCDLHRRLFGSEPQGVWMPECAYRPAGAWRHPVTGESEAERPGNEEFLAAAGLAWTVVDAHLLRAGESAFPYGSDLDPEEVVEPSGPHPHPYWIGRSRVAAFLRDARTAAQVWSRQGGYPGDPRYLDFHKRHWPSGLRFWRVTHPEADLGDKLVYWPQDAADAARAQAEHFVSLVGGMPEMAGGVVVCPFDAELFGHWWFEGPAWLEHVLDVAGEDPLVSSTTPARELALAPPRKRARFGEGSWGAGGDHRVWVNPETEWMWRDLGAAERRAFAAVPAGAPAAPWQRAALNQLLLQAASDWPFLVTMETGRDYAEERFREHRDRLAEILDAGPAAALPAWAAEDLPFPDVDPAWSAGEES